MEEIIEEPYPIWDYDEEEEDVITANITPPIDNTFDTNPEQETVDPAVSRRLSEDRITSDSQRELDNFLYTQSIDNRGQSDFLEGVADNFSAHWYSHTPTSGGKYDEALAERNEELIAYAEKKGVTLSAYISSTWDDEDMDDFDSEYYSEEIYDTERLYRDVQRVFGNEEDFTIQSSADIKERMRKDAIQRDDKAAYAGGVAKVAGVIGAEIVDPINLAINLATMSTSPAIGGAIFKTSSPALRNIIMAGAENMVAESVAIPGRVKAARIFDYEYGAKQAAWDVLAAGLFGSGLMGAGQGVKKILDMSLKKGILVAKGLDNTKAEDGAAATFKSTSDAIEGTRLLFGKAKIEAQAELNRVKDYLGGEEQFDKYMRIIRVLDETEIQGFPKRRFTQQVEARFISRIYAWRDGIINNITLRKEMDTANGVKVNEEHYNHTVARLTEDADLAVEHVKEMRMELTRGEGRFDNPFTDDPYLERVLRDGEYNKPELSRAEKELTDLYNEAYATATGRKEKLEAGVDNTVEASRVQKGKQAMDSVLDEMEETHPDIGNEPDFKKMREDSLYMKILQECGL